MTGRTRTTSSESDVFERDESRHSHRRRSSSSRKGSATSSKLGNLTSKLQETNRNLEEVDHMLGEYRHLGNKKASSMDQLRDDLARTHEELHEERYRQAIREGSQITRPLSALESRGGRRRHTPTSPLRDYDKASSDREGYGDYDRRYLGRSRSGVRFYDDMDAGHIHGLHQSIRDLTSEQLRIEDDLNREVDRRKRMETTSLRSLNELRNSFRGPDNQMSSLVDQRLQNIQAELQAERNVLKKRQDEVGQISSELKQALLDHRSAPSSVTSDLDARSRLVQAETRKDELEVELEKVRRRLAQAEGGRDGMMDQIEELRRQLSTAEKESYNLQLTVQDREHALTESRSRCLSEDKDRAQWQSDRRQMEEELRELRSQLTKSASAMGDYGEIRKELDRSEKQRTQLSDHIQVLGKDMETKEKTLTKITSQLQEMTTKFHDTDRQKHQSLLQLEDALKRLRDTTREAENLASELRHVQAQLDEADKKREEIKARAQETVKQWKIKCKKLERDVDHHQLTSRQTVERNEQMAKELENLRIQTNTGQLQMEQLKRELGEILAVRAQQDEQLRLRDIENNELKAFKMDLDRDLRDCKMVIERLEQELGMTTEKSSRIFEEKTKVEDQLGGMQSQHMMLQNQVHHMQIELKDFSVQKVDLANQLANMATERQELRNLLQASRKAEASTQEELTMLARRMKEEKEVYSNKTQSMKSELDQYKMRESHLVGDITCRFKAEQAEYEAEVHALKLQVQEDNSSRKILRKQVEKLKEEMENLHAQLASSQEEQTQLEKKYKKLKEKYTAKTLYSEDDVMRAKDVEVELQDVRDAMRRLEGDYQNILHSVHAEVDSLVDIVTPEFLGSKKLLTVGMVTPDEPQKWLLELKLSLHNILKPSVQWRMKMLLEQCRQNQLEWLKTVFREKCHKEHQLRSTLCHKNESSEKDRQFFIKEIARQNTVLDKLTQKRQELTDGIKEHDVDETLGNLSPIKDDLESLHASLIREQEAILKKADELSREEAKLLISTPAFQESKLEREKIHERYSKLQETMNILKQELHDTKQLSELFKPVSPTPTRQVRVCSPDQEDNTTDVDSPPISAAEYWT